MDTKLFDESSVVFVSRWVWGNFFFFECCRSIEDRVTAKWVEDCWLTFRGFFSLTRFARGLWWELTLRKLSSEVWRRYSYLSIVILASSFVPRNVNCFATSDSQIRELAILMSFVLDKKCFEYLWCHPLFFKKKNYVVTSKLEFTNLNREIASFLCYSSYGAGGNIIYFFTLELWLFWTCIEVWFRSSHG